VPVEAVREIADLLDLSPAEVHDTMTFYGFFRDEQHALGRTRLWVCRSLPCMLRGGEEVLGELCRKLDVKPGGTSADRKITVEFAECLGVCEGAPVVLINDEHRMNVTPEKVDGLIQELRQ
jgi:NADH-quinone oxidoreductase subunit E